MRLNRIRWFALATVALAAGCAHRGEPADRSRTDTMKWANVAGWEIRVDPSVGDGCFMLAGFAGGRAARVGFDRRRELAYILIVDVAWTSIRAGEPYEVTLRFGDRSTWDGTGHGFAEGSARGLVMYFAKADFLIRLATEPDVTLVYGGKPVARIPLRGSDEAGREMLNCQIAVEESRPPRREAADPFASPPAASPPAGRPDPFAK